MEQKEFYVTVTIREDGATKVEGNIAEKDIQEFLITAILNLERLGKQGAEPADQIEAEVETETQ